MKDKKTSVFVALFLIFIPFFFITTVYWLSYDILKKGREYKPHIATEIYDINGAVISRLFDESRVIVDSKDISPHIKRAFVVAEDKNFYSHRGLDFGGIVRALIIDILTGNLKQGGSTITQQLVKQLYTKQEKTFSRKIIELIIANEFERKYSKDKILEMYLNQIYFGHGVYGIGSAAEFFFNKKAGDVNLVEAALLASIPAAPNRYSPFKNPELAFKRNRAVLFQLIYSGYVSKDKAGILYDKFWEKYLIKIKTISPTLSIRNELNDRAQYFTEHVRRILVKKYGENRVYRGGLKVYTTLDLRQNDIAREELLTGINRQRVISQRYNKRKIIRHTLSSMNRSLKKRKLKKAEIKLHNKFMSAYNENSIFESLLLSELFDMYGAGDFSRNYLGRKFNFNKMAEVEGAIVGLNSKTGGVRAMVGGSDFYSRNQLNRVTQARRQPGSAFKPFIYGAGIESKIITAGSSFSDLPIIFKGRRKTWVPSNYNKKFSGRVLVRRALARSLNIISVLIYKMVGGERVASFTSKLIRVPLKRLDKNPTLAMGTSEFTPLEIATGYSVFANRGIEVIPHSINKIVDRNGKEIYTFKKGIKRVISKKTSFIMTSLLRSVVDSGTAYYAVRKAGGFKYGAAGKTGTNTKFRDAWFAGYSSDLTAVVWIGSDFPGFSLGSGQSGSIVAAPIWGRFMKRVYSSKKPKRFPGPPRGIRRVSICRVTGKRAVKGCKTRREYFIKGTAPKVRCNSIHSISGISGVSLIGKMGLIKKAKIKFSKLNWKNSLNREMDITDDNIIEENETDNKKAEKMEVEVK